MSPPYAKRRVLALCTAAVLSLSSAESLAQDDTGSLPDRIESLRAAAAAGAPDATLALGAALLDSPSEAHWGEAIGWLEKAARQGAPVTLLIADSYRTGHGVAKDLETAVTWYRLGAESGDPIAQLELGLMLLDGEGVERDMVQAILYLRLADAALSNPDHRRAAEQALERAQWWTSSEDLKKAEALLQDWTPKSLPDLLN